MVKQRREELKNSEILKVATRQARQRAKEEMASQYTIQLQSKLKLGLNRSITGLVKNFAYQQYEDPLKVKIQPSESLFSATRED